MKELAKIETLKQEQKIEIFSTKGGLEPYMQHIEQELKGFVPDLTTVTGRKAIATMARKVSTSKGMLDDEGKELVSELKKKPALIDAERKRMRDWCDAKRDETRKPLTDWENAEKERVAEINQRIYAITAYESIEISTSAQAKEQLALIQAMKIDDSFGDLQEQAAMKHELAISRLTNKSNQLEGAEQAAIIEEAKRIESDRLAKIEREAAIALEAEERAKQQARDEAERVKAEAEQESAKIKAESERKEREAKEASERRELELKLAAETAERKSLEAEERAKQANIDAQRKVEADKQAEIDAAARREANTKHKAKINNAALNALVDLGISKEHAKSAVVAIAEGKVPAVKISY